MAEQYDGRRLSVTMNVTHWWSRFDTLANYQLDRIFRSRGFLGGDITDPKAVDLALRAAVEDPDVIAELEDWVQMVSDRRKGDSIQNPFHRLEERIRHLTDRFDAAAISPEMLDECLGRIAGADDLFDRAYQMPEMVAPDEESVALFRRYLSVRNRFLVLAAAR